MKRETKRQQLGELAELRQRIAELEKSEAERVRTEQTLERRMTELEAVNAMATIVAECLDVEEILNRAMDEVLERVGVEAAAMLLLDEESRELEMVAHRGLSDEFVQTASRMKLGEGLAGRAAQTGQPAVIARLDEYVGALAPFVEKERIQSAASVPLLGSTGVIGVMNVGTASPDYFDAAGLELLLDLGQQIATGLEKVRLHESEREAAATAAAAQTAMDTIVAMGDGLILNTLDGRITFVNPAFEEMTGYEKRELLGRDAAELAQELVKPADVERSLSAIGAALEGKIPGPVPVTLVSKAGREVPTTFTVSFIRDAKGKPATAVVVFKDITAIRRTEEALRESEERYATITRNLPGGLVHILDGDFRYVFSEGEELGRLGLSKEELVGKCIHDVLPPDTAKVVAANYRRVLEGESVSFVGEYGGQAFLVRAVPLYDANGQINHILVLSVNINERRKAERALQESEQWLSTTLSSIGDAVIATDPRGSLTFINPVAQTLTAWTEEEALGKPVAEIFNIINQETGEQAENPVAKVIREGVVVGLANHTILIAKDGTRRPIDDSGAPIRGENGNIMGAVLVFRDITERVRMEEERNRLFNLSIDMLCIAGFDGFFKQHNPSWSKTLGWTEEELLSKPWLEFVHPEDRQATVAAGEQLISGKPVISFENRYLCRDGSYRWISWNSFPLPEEELIFAVARDITPLKQMDEALRQSRRELLIQNQIANIFLTIPDEEMYDEVLSVVLEVMESEYGVFGYIDEQGDLVVPSMTRHIWDKCQVADKRFVFSRETWGDSTWPQAIREKKTIVSNEPSTNVPEGHIAIRRHISMPVIYQGEAVGLFQVANKETDYDEGTVRLLETIANYVAPVLNARLQRDRSDKVRKRAEEELKEYSERLEQMVEERTLKLRESEAKFRMLAEQSPNMIFINKRGSVVYANRLSLELIGYTRDEFYSADFDFLSLIAPESIEVVRSNFSKHMRGEEVTPYENTLITKDGKKYETIVATKLINYEGDRAILGMVTDITERKMTEQKLKEYSERLEEMVEERAKELREAQEQLVRREKLAVLGQLAGGVGHELRNPLGVISNAVYFLQMVLSPGEPLAPHLPGARSAGGDAGSDADETTQEYLGIIASEVHNAERIISDLLDFSRTQSAEREEVAVSDLIAEVLERRPPPENVEVTARIPPDLPPVFVDPGQIGQVLDNLVTNAYQAMPEGGQLVVETLEVFPKLPKSGWVSLSVADTGCGIPRENMAKIFEPLFTTRAKGIGLGLAVARNLVELNGGSIEVESKEGEGSTFTVTLPTREVVA